MVPVAPRSVQRDAAGRFAAGSGRPLRRRPGAQPANVNAARDPWRSYWKRRALRKEDEWVLSFVREYAGSLASDRGGAENATAAELHMIEIAATAHGCVMLIMAEAAKKGGIVGPRRGATTNGGGLVRSVVDPDYSAALSRFLAIEARALQAIGMERKAKAALTPEQYWAQRQATRAAQPTGAAEQSGGAVVVVPGKAE